MPQLPIPSICCSLPTLPSPANLHTAHMSSGALALGSCAAPASAAYGVIHSHHSWSVASPPLRCFVQSPLRLTPVKGRRHFWKSDGKPYQFQRWQAALAIPHLQPEEFSHPLDRQSTAILRAIPGLNDLGRILLGSVSEQVMLLENIGTSILVSEKQLPDLHKLMVEAAAILNLDPPDLYVRQNPVPNAYTLAIGGRKPFVVIHTSLVELLTPTELQAVIAHELGHLKCDHGLWLTFANILALGAYSLPGLGVAIARSLEEQLMRWVRAAELTCDRAALLVTQDQKVVISVLMKLAGGSPSLASQLNVDAFLEQAHSYDEASSSPLGWYIRNAQTRQLSHPLPVLRAREINTWAKSTEYQNLIARAIKANSQPTVASRK